MKQYKAIKTMNNEKLINAHKELKMEKLPQGRQSIVRSLQSELFKEENKTVALTSVKYYVAMEVIERFSTIANG